MKLFQYWNGQLEIKKKNPTMSCKENLYSSLKRLIPKFWLNV